MTHQFIRHHLFASLLSLAFAASALALQVAPERSAPIPAESLFAPDRVVEIEFHLPESDWDAIRMQSRSLGEALGKLPAESPFTYVKADMTIDGHQIREVGLRKKGFLGSLDDQRPSLKVKFNEYVDQDPVAGLDRLTLNNNKQDGSRICQYLSYKLFRDSGTIAPRCGFARVSVNGESLGVYSNVESIGTEFLQRGFGDGSGDLFEGTICDFYPDWIQKFEKKNKNADVGPLLAVAELLQSESVDLSGLREAIDLDAFVNYWAMESLLGFWDSYSSNQNNFFVYVNPQDGKLCFVPWGADSAFTKTTPLPPFVIRPMSVHSQAVLPNKLYRIPEVQSHYLDILKSFIDLHWQEEKLLADIDRLEELLRDSVLSTNTEFTSTLNKTRAFVRSRRSDLVKEFEGGPPRLLSKERLPAYSEKIGTAVISFSTRWYDTTPRETLGLGDVQIELEIGGKTVPVDQVGAYAEFSKWPTPEPEKPPSIVIVATRKSDGKHLTFGTGLTAAQFVPGTNDATIGGVYVEERNFFNIDRMRFISGTVQLSEAAMEDGQPVRGRMQLSIVALKGGEPVSDD